MAFSFERYNGILGAFSNNGRNIEVQLMRKFMTMRKTFDMNSSMPSLYEEYFQPFVQTLLGADFDVDFSLCGHETAVACAKASYGPLELSSSVWANLSQLVLPSVYQLCCLDTDELSLLHHTYQAMYPASGLTTDSVSRTFKEYGWIEHLQQRYGSKFQSRLGKYGRIMASWSNESGDIVAGGFVPGQVKYYLVHSVHLDGKPVKHCFAVVNWHRHYNQPTVYRNPLSVCHENRFVDVGPLIYLPIQRIHSRFLAAREVIGNTATIVVCPLTRMTYL